MSSMGLMGFYDEAVPCVFAKLKAEAISLLLEVFYGFYEFCELNEFNGFDGVLR
jgi:hypothetical protein